MNKRRVSEFVGARTENKVKVIIIPWESRPFLALQTNKRHKDNSVTSVSLASTNDGSAGKGVIPTFCFPEPYEIFHDFLQGSSV